MFATGDVVRFQRMPPDVEAMPDEMDELHTRHVFRRCVGRTFRVRGAGSCSLHLFAGCVESWVHEGDDCYNVAAADTIWPSPEYLEPMSRG